MLVLATFAWTVPFGSLSAQQVTTAVVPDTVTVGDVFHAAVQVLVPASVRVGFPDSLDVTGNIENAGQRQLVVDTMGGARRITAMYPLTAWRPGPTTLPSVGIVVADSTGQRSITVPLQPLTVASVLPKDTAGIKPKPARGVVGGYGVPWAWILAGLAAILLLAAVVFYMRRRRRRVPVAPAVTPATARQRALAALEAIRADLSLEGEGVKQFYIAATAIVRQYVAEVWPDLGTEYTTRELARLARRSMESGSVSDLVRLLESADLVKFAQRRPGSSAILGDWGALRTWVEQHPATAAAEPAEVAA